MAKFEPFFGGCFASINDLNYHFQNNIDEFGQVLYASYDQFGYEGAVYCLTLINGELHDVEGSHCSCYGLEDLWNPQKTNLKAVQTYVEGQRCYFPFPTQEQFDRIKKYLNRKGIE